MDGNGRWAKGQGLKRSDGHKAGSETAKSIVTSCRKLGVRHLTLYTFSKENWKRPQDEVRTLFELLVSFLKRELASLLEQDIRLRVLGEWSDLPFAARQVLKHTVSKTEHCKSMTLNLALNYSGRGEIVRAVKEIMASGVSADAVTEETISEHLYTKGQPDPDLIIRTSGELRLSNYLLYQSAYSEFYFTDTLWPDFSEQELIAAIEQFGKRSRRFGLTGEQLES